MYNPPTYLTSETLNQILAEFSWPSAFEIREEDCTVDGIKVRFPKCIVYFREGFESDISFYLANPILKDIKYWSSFDLIHYVYEPAIRNTPSFKEPALNNFFSPFASLEKVENGLRDICILIKTYLYPCIDGDYSLIEEYNNQHPEKPL
jgi:hypothetical protein